MARRLENLTLDNLDDLEAVSTRCRSCAFWELGPVADHRPPRNDEAREAKALWVGETLREWGSCGQVLQVDGEPAGHALYAPPSWVPRSAAFATSPAADDAVLLFALRVRPELAGGGLGRMLVQAVARDVVRRGIRAIEAYGTGPLLSGPVGEPGCLLPAGFLRAVGFRTVRPHPVTPRLRMELRTAATWREDVEQALERLLGRNPAATR